jgi:hypothetical protein
MTSPILASTNPHAGITAFNLTESKAQKLWSGGDIQDGNKDPAATRFRLEVDEDLCEVYRETATNVFRFKFTSRVSIVHNDKTTGTQWALTEEQRGKMKQKLCIGAMVGGTEQMKSIPERPAYLLDNVRQQDSTEDIIKDLGSLLRISASRRQKSMAASQSHWGIQNFVDAYVDETTIGDIALKMISHLEDRVSQGLLHTLKNISAGSKHHDDGPLSTGPMSSSEAFAAVVLEFEICLQLAE